MSSITRLHDAVRGGDLTALTAVLDDDARLCNARSEADPRGTYPLHVAAEGSGNAFPTRRWRIGADASSCFAADSCAMT